MVIVMTPPHVHIHVEVLLSAGLPFIITVGEPGTQGVAVAGIQGIGVNTPKAAAVAEATTGLVGVIHIPKGGMLTMGMWSMIVAAGGPPALTGIPIGITLRVLGAMPKLHIIIAPATTSWLIV